MNKFPLKVTDGDVVTDLRSIVVSDVGNDGQVDLSGQFAPLVSTVVGSSAASVSPSAADSGKTYVLSHANPTFVLPTSTSVAGETQFWFVMQTDGAATGTVDSGTGGFILASTFDISDSDFTGTTTETVTPIATNLLFHLRYLGSDLWASNIISQVA
jgi:hypothetical protein